MVLPDSQPALLKSQHPHYRLFWSFSCYQPLIKLLLSLLGEIPVWNGTGVELEWPGVEQEWSGVEPELLHRVLVKALRMTFGTCIPRLPLPRFP